MPTLWCTERTHLCSLYQIDSINPVGNTLWYFFFTLGNFFYSKHYFLKLTHNNNKCMVVVMECICQYWVHSMSVYHAFSSEIPNMFLYIACQHKAYLTDSWHIQYKRSVLGQHKEMFCIHAFLKVVASCFRELGQHKSKKSRTTQCAKTRLVWFRWREPVHSNDTNVIGLMCNIWCRQWKTTKIYSLPLREWPTQAPKAATSTNIRHAAAGSCRSPMVPKSDDFREGIENTSHQRQYVTICMLYCICTSPNSTITTS